MSGLSYEPTGSGPVFLVLERTGAAPTVDALVRLHASRSVDGERRSFEREVTGDRGAALDELARFVGDAPIVVRTGTDALAPELERRLERRWHGLDELCGWMLARPTTAALRTPDELERALVDAVRSLRAIGPAATDWVVRTSAALAPRWRENDVVLARWLERAAEILGWAASRDATGPAEPWPTPAEPDDPLDDLVATAHDLVPHWTAALPTGDPFPPRLSDPTPFPDEDFATLDRCFERELPALFGADETGYRAGQHELARAVAKSLGLGELLVVHAPTGTGKTLGYLVPVALWAHVTACASACRRTRARCKSRR